MADLGDVAEAGLGTYAYTKQQELIAKNPEYRKYTERQQSIGLYILGGLAVIIGGVLLFGGKSKSSSSSNFGNENNLRRMHARIFIRAMNSQNKNTVTHLASLFQNSGNEQYAARLQQRANTL